MTAVGRRALVRLAALLLGAAAVLFAWRFGHESGAGAAPAGCLAPERVPEARARLARLLDGLATLQEQDGGFALERLADRPNPPEPEVKRTAASALAAWALGEGVDLGVASAGARVACERARVYLLAHQQPDGGLGRMPPGPLGAPDRGPEVTALAGALLAFAPSPVAEHGLFVGRVTRVFAPLLQAGPRDGWQRALCAMAVEALVRAGRGEALGREPRKVLPLGATRNDPDCGDYRLAEAIVRTLRGETLTGDLFPEAVLTACVTRETPTWSGQTTDVASWLMQAWLAARSRQGPAWFAAALTPLEEGQGPDGVIPGGIYSDRVTQTACGALVIVQGLRTQAVMK